MPPSQPRRPPPKAARLDPKIWRACAGAAVQIPAVHSRVYYFPQGHLEQAFPPSLPHHHYHLNPLLRPLPFVLCRVSAVQFLADPLSDEVFAKLLLNPIAAGDRSAGEEAAEEPDSGGEKVLSFAKILTPSDANNGGGFSVPRFCADSIFPALDFNDDPPVQVLSVTDVHGVAWEFRHIYRGTPRRHLLTTGWSKFVNHKKLVAGDSVVFMKNSRGSLFVGIRRTLRFPPVTENRDPWQQEEEEEEDGHGGGSGGSPVFSRDGRGKVSAKAVAEAAELAARNVPFEVVYYPRAGWSDFVVKAEAVEGAMKAAWCPGMRVKMAVETEDSSRMTWFQGTVSSASAPDNGLWRGSPWRMLQVTWDEPEVLQNAKRVSPWQVELISPTPSLHIAFPPMKKFRAAQGSGVLSDREGDPFFPMTGFTNSTMEHLSQTLLSYDTSFPAGMQGARHDLFSPSSFSNFLNDNSHLRMGSSFFGNTTEPRLTTVSTELNIGSCQSGDLSPDSPSSLHSYGPEFTGTNNCNVSKVGSGSIQLFGKIIKPVAIELHDAGCLGDDGCKSCNENETESIDNPVGHSLTYSKLLNRLDVESQRASPVEACYL